ncbi:MAG: DNA methyltransferase [Chloroflexota bacterium]
MDTNVIYCGDCLLKLKEIPDDSVDLIYIDPPFSSNRNYVAFWQEQEKRHFEDRFENVSAYLDYMHPRVKELYRVLKPTGSFYYHCDWHASHYIKVMLDRDDLFGYRNFQNEIIWYFRGGGASKRRFAKKHEVIFLYTKGEKWTFNLDEVRQPYSADVINSLPSRYDKSYRGDKVYSGYKPNPLGKIPDDVWPIQPIMPSDKKERLGYPTQKPLALLENIIKASSNEGDIVLDAFCGCWTTIVKAQLLERKWIGIDISPTACRVVAKRLEDTTGIKEGKDFIIKDLPKTVEELRVYPAFEFQNWAVNALGGVPNKIRVRDKGIDGKLYPIEDIKKEKKEGLDLFGDIDRYIPIQVKRTDQVGRPDIENFEVAMKRDKREKGIFIGFDFSRDALQEIRRAEREEGLLIEPKTVSQIVEDQLDKSLL